jgi:hypothetical protein
MAGTPNTPLELTSLRAEQDRFDCESQDWLDRFPDLHGGAAQRQAVRPHISVSARKV